MNSEILQLNKIHNDLKIGKTATPVTIREFLSWFGAQRRSTLNVDYINSQLAHCDIQTVPGYLNIWVDTPITFELISEKGKRDDGPPEDSLSETISLGADPMDVSQDKALTVDPSFRVGKLKAARQVLVSVKPNDSVTKAMTLMLARNLSQLPVMTGERDVKGVISWTSIGERFAVGKTGAEVQHFMNDHLEISINSSLYAAISIIAQSNYALVRDGTNKISGIITANDIAMQFEETSTPFLLLSEIENHLRVLIDGKITIEDIVATCDKDHLPKGFSKISDLTFGNYVYLLDHTDNWLKVGLRLDKAAFVSEIKEINKIRNEVMHFDPDSIKPEDLIKLRDVSRLLDTIGRMASS